MATAKSNAPFTDFGNLNLGNYVGSLNSFMETHKADRIEYTIDHLFDLSNNHSVGTDQRSLGDFRDAMTPTCPGGGCDFPFTLTTDSFSSRLRGYFNVTEELVGKEIHFGFYVDDAVSLSFFDKNASTYNVMIRPPQLGVTAWRLTETVIFEQAGLYPIEILYVEIAEHAALEMSYYIGPFIDFERMADEPPILELDAAGFTLFPKSMFFQTVKGTTAFLDPSACLQCDRQFANQPGGCGDGYYCNDAALCAPCNTDLSCGPSCTPCGGATPVCADMNGNAVCIAGCVDDDDCDRGEKCQENTCVACTTSDSCAGNSCNCCPGGMDCRVLDPTALPVCVECDSDADCANKEANICDVVLGRCVEKQPEATCSSNGGTCPAERPFCVPNPYDATCAECRWDTDCSAGMFCRNGECRPCTEDKHCGLRCQSCSGDTPFCFDGQTPERSMCVRCVDDSDCNGGTCNSTTHGCDAPGCAVSCQECEADNPECVPTYCNGRACVPCYADTQCPCGGTCDRATNTCSDSCRTNSDCLGTEHCSRGDDSEGKQCVIGAIDNDIIYCPRPGMCCGDGCCGCSASTGGSGKVPWDVAGLFILTVLALLAQRRKRRMP